MKGFAVSNIAWSPSEDDYVAQVLTDNNVTLLEIAPTKIWPELVSVTSIQTHTLKQTWLDRGVDIIAFQSLLFGGGEMQVFGTLAEQQNLLERLQVVCRLAEQLGANRLVFGSPKNRQRGNVTYDRAFDQAVKFFNQASDIAEDYGVVLCIEPNPKEYGCDFVTNAAEGIQLVKAVDRSGFGLHLDAAAMTMAQDEIRETLRAARPLLRHFHASAPWLGQVGAEDGVEHRVFGRELMGIGYDGVVSIEMKEDVEAGVPAAQRVEHAISHVKKYYEAT